MNIARSFVEYMEDSALGTFNDDIYIGSAPLDALDPIWWVVTTGGSVLSENQSGEKQKIYTLNVFFRDIDEENVYETMQNFEVLVNSEGCTQLNGFDTIGMQATLFPADQDLDAEDRTVGLVQVTVRTYL